MNVTQIAVVGETSDDVLAGVRQLPVSRMCLLLTPAHRQQAADVQRVLASLQVTTEARVIGQDPMMEVIRVVSDEKRAAARARGEVHLNISGGPTPLVAAATAAAFMHGLPAFIVADGACLPLPILQFAYNDLVSPAKMEILRVIHELPQARESLQALASAMGTEKSLLSYHLRGSGDGKGLEQLGLVRVQRGARGRLQLHLTPMGETFIAAYGTSSRDAARRPAPPGGATSLS